MTSRARQRAQAEVLVRGHGQVVAEFFDTGESRMVAHRAGAAWTFGTVTSILGNPRYTGRQVWNRQRTDSELADPANTSLGHKSGAAVEPARWVGHLRQARAPGAGQRG